MMIEYKVVIDQPDDDDATACILNALMCVDDDHWRDAKLIQIRKVEDK